MCFRARGLSFRTSSSTTSLIDVESFEHVEHVLNHMIAKGTNVVSFKARKYPGCHQHVAKFLWQFQRFLSSLYWGEAIQRALLAGKGSHADQLLQIADEFLAADFVISLAFSSNQLWVFQADFVRKKVEFHYNYCDVQLNSHEVITWYRCTSTSYGHLTSSINLWCPTLRISY